MVDKMLIICLESVGVFHLFPRVGPFPPVPGDLGWLVLSTDERAFYRTCYQLGIN